MELNNRKKYLIRKFYDDYLDLNKSMEDEQLTVESIRNGVEPVVPVVFVLVQGLQMLTN